MSREQLKPQFDTSFAEKKEHSQQYMRTVVLMFLKAVNEVAGCRCRVCVEFKYVGGYYVVVHGVTQDEAFAEAVKKKMQEYRKQDLSVTPVAIRTKNAIQKAREEGDFKQENLLNYVVASKVFYHELDGFRAFFNDSLLDSTGEVGFFDLVPFRGGLLLLLPDEDGNPTPNEKYHSEKLFEMQREGEEFAYKTGMDCLSDLNDAICAEEAGETVLMQEAYFEKQICDAANEIIRRKSRFVLLAGPSSSGKTTTTHRLAIQLKTFGYEPQVISADDYFRPKEEFVFLPDGTPDFESIRAVDTDLFNEDMLKLLGGEEVEIPKFNFVTQAREYKGKKISLGEKKIIIIEGIHCLNPAFSEKIPEESKMRVYLSAVTPLNLNDHSPISTSDCRLLRRIVRDNRTRGTSASETIALWPGVRMGEKEYIFPYQDMADMMINTTLVYELAALKLAAAPLLFAIKSSDPQFKEARRLLRFLEYVLPMSPEAIPRTSIIREFIGGSLIDIS